MMILEGIVSPQVPVETFDLCFDFAKKRAARDDHLYSLSSNTSVDTKKNQILDGALGEIGVSLILSGNGIAHTPPDFNLYDSEKRSFDKDMLVDGQAVQIKTQNFESMNRYGLSWTFQRGNDSGRMDGIFYSDKKYHVAFCLYKGGRVIVCAICDLRKLQEQELFRLPKIASLHGEKGAVYYSDLAKFTLGERWSLDILGEKPAYCRLLNITFPHS